MAKIDDAMVDRALSAGRWERSCHTRKRMLESLEAALNSIEPEIIITDSCGHDFVDFAMVSDFLSVTPGRMIGAVKLCRKCYAKQSPVEPEIEVAEEQIEAGCRIFHSLGAQMPGFAGNAADNQTVACVKTIYRAMARLAPKENEHLPEWTWCDACQRWYGADSSHGMDKTMQTRVRSTTCPVSKP